jgi:hypothetical protein
LGKDFVFRSQNFSDISPHPTRFTRKFTGTNKITGLKINNLMKRQKLKGKVETLKKRID